VKTSLDLFNLKIGENIEGIEINGRPFLKMVFLVFVNCFSIGLRIFEYEQ